MEDADRTKDLKTQVDSAVADRTPLEIRGGGSKTFYGGKSGSPLQLLETAGHRGIVHYAPTELVITARAGTLIRDINAALAEKNQRIPFEPPEMNGHGTLGGTLATGFSGPARPWAGAARDHVLGTRVLNGRGQVLRFGGEVMKNVAGYDVSRLMVGAMGTLGVILESSFKVLPEPEREASLVLEMDHDSGLDFITGLGAQPLPLSGAVLHDGSLRLRLSGTEAGVGMAMRRLGGEELVDGEGFWRNLREFTHPFFETGLPVWRISLPAGARPDLPGEVLVDWGGSQWWLGSRAPAEAIREPVSGAGGHATLFRGGNRECAVFHPLSPAMAALQERIRASFDPEGIFNPGRMIPPGQGG
ncbi:MAG: glycolate oxidase subunit GlcE [Gammaproteobacteria bacterium]|nr:glycolate oxidase subunit GlcE [Gammaproteobacteria bacterium]MYG65740.1 glycolate oxidase subunit GlcE [Gammaproteobacteria bacterium]